MGHLGRFDNEPSWRMKESAPALASTPPSDLPFADDGEAAYLRRLAMSTRPGAPAFAPPATDAPIPTPAPTAPPLAMSGEDAYLRRLAMSGGAAAVTRLPSPPPPVFTAMAGDEDQAYIPVSPPPQAPASLPPAALAADVKAKRDAAAAIAARLSQLAQQQSQPMALSTAGPAEPYLGAPGGDTTLDEPQ